MLPCGRPRVERGVGAVTALLQVDKLTKGFTPRGRSVLRRRQPPRLAVDDVSFTIERGKSLALVGESGAGKSTVGRLILRLIEPDSGSVRFDGLDVLQQSPSSLRNMRKKAQMIFQDPYSSLDPRMTVAESVGEPLLVHFGTDRGERDRMAAAMLDRVGLGSRFLHRYPVELSGGQLQRVAIARVLTLEPDFVVCDEPTAALDVSVQAQVLNILGELQRELGLSYLFITHDLALVDVIADDVIVMQSGKVVEQGTVDQVLHNPREAYTSQLLDAVPRPIPRSLRDELPV